jgi:hypothetical protein
MGNSGLIRATKHTLREERESHLQHSVLNWVRQDGEYHRFGREYAHTGRTGEWHGQTRGWQRQSKSKRTVHETPAPTGACKNRFSHNRKVGDSEVVSNVPFVATLPKVRLLISWLLIPPLNRSMRFSTCKLPYPIFTTIFGCDDMSRE